MIGISLFVMFIILVALSLLMNRDVFSPAKFYLLNLGAYFAAVFLKDYSYYVYFNYILLLFIGLLIIILEPNKIRSNNFFKKSKTINSKMDVTSVSKYISIIWVLSIIPMLAQLYLINEMGGLHRYINTINQRVVLWQGMGMILELIRMYGVINLIYFVIIISVEKLGVKIKFFYLLHFAIYILIGFMTGSRGALLGNFVLMIVAYHYLRKRITFKIAILSMVFLLVLASIIGVARGGYSLTEDGFSTGLRSAEKLLDLNQFSYGLAPIELVYRNQQSDLEYGMTYLTPVTNLVPRSIWPGKPDTGGLVLTKKYTGNAWGGYSNLSTGIIAEGVINFGLILGPLVGAILIFSLMMYLLWVYKKVIITLSNKSLQLKDLVFLMVYLFLLTSIPGLLVSEWTKGILGIVMRVAKLLFVYLFLCIFSITRPRNVALKLGQPGTKIG